MMTRRTLNRALAAAAMVALLPGKVSTQELPRARNVVLVHGLFADGSCWSEVIPKLQAAGLDVTSVQKSGEHRGLSRRRLRGEPLP